MSIDDPQYSWPIVPERRRPATAAPRRVAISNAELDHIMQMAQRARTLDQSRSPDQLDEVSRLKEENARLKREVAERDGKIVRLSRRLETAEGVRAANFRADAMDDLDPSR